MPFKSRQPPGSLGLSLVVAGIIAALAVVVPVTAAYAADPPVKEAWPSPAGEDRIICNMSVAGTLASKFPNRPRGWDHMDKWVVWGPDVGFSTSFACTIRLGAGTGADDFRKLWFNYLTFGPTGSLAQPFFWESPTSAPFDAANSTLVASNLFTQYGMNCYMSEEVGASVPCNRAPPGQRPGYAVNYISTVHRETIHSLTHEGRNIVIRGRFDMLPGRMCGYNTGETWPFANGTAGTCFVVPGGHLYVLMPRAGACMTFSTVRADTASSPQNPGIFTNSCSFGNPTKYNDSGDGQEVPPTVPDYDPPGGMPREPDGSGSCSVGSWLLSDKDSGTKWSQSVATEEISFTASHSYDLRVRFTGSPPSIGAKVKQNSQDVWGAVHYKPTSPDTFTFTGISGKALLVVTGYSLSGDIDPKCQGTITDEPEKEGPDRYRDCLASVPGITWNAPSTWVPGLGGAFICAMQRVFVPEKSMTERAEELRNANPTSAAIADGVSSAQGAIGALGSPAAASCSGPSVVIPPSPTPQYPASVCAGSSLASGAYWAKRTAELAVLLAAAVAIWNLIAGQIWGARTIVYRPSTDGMHEDHNESGAWS